MGLMMSSRTTAARELSPDDTVLKKKIPQYINFWLKKINTVSIFLREYLFLRGGGSEKNLGEGYWKFTQSYFLMEEGE